VYVSGLFRHRFKVLLGALMTLLLVMPVVLELPGNATTGKIVLTGGSAFVMLAAAAVVGGGRTARLFAAGLLVPSLLLEIAAAFFWPADLLPCHFAVRTALVGFIVVALLRQIFLANEISFDMVCASLCVYLLLGAIWENVYALLDIAVPGSIVTVTRTQAETLKPAIDSDAVRSLRMRYFSLATLTSVGYGDVIPGTTVVRMCAVTEALMGQIYLLVMVSRLVGLQVSQTLSASASDRPEKRNTTSIEAEVVAAASQALEGRQ
jgi:hypothetical protein